MPWAGIGRRSMSPTPASRSARRCSSSTASSSMKSELALLLKALAFAAHKHRDQRRKDPAASPYINHPIALADVLVNEGGVTDVEVLCAALLHDTVEDTDTTPQELEENFGPRIARIRSEERRVGTECRCRGWPDG